MVCQFGLDTSLTSHRAGQTEEEKRQPYGTMDDSSPGNSNRARDAVAAFAKIMPGGGYEAPALGDELVKGQGGYSYHWSGIIGMVSRHRCIQPA